MKKRFICDWLSVWVTENASNVNKFNLETFFITFSNRDFEWCETKKRYVVGFNPNIIGGFPPKKGTKFALRCLWTVTPFSFNQFRIDCQFMLILCYWSHASLVDHWMQGRTTRRSFLSYKGSRKESFFLAQLTWAIE